jgi:hypothetical protein
LLVRSSVFVRFSCILHCSCVFRAFFRASCVFFAFYVHLAFLMCFSCILRLSHVFRFKCARKNRISSSWRACMVMMACVHHPGARDDGARASCHQMSLTLNGIEYFLPE